MNITKYLKTKNKLDFSKFEEQIIKLFKSIYVKMMFVVIMVVIFTLLSGKKENIIKKPKIKIPIRKIITLKKKDIKIPVPILKNNELRKCIVECIRRKKYFAAAKLAKKLKSAKEDIDKILHDKAYEWYLDACTIYEINKEKAIFIWNKLLLLIPQGCNLAKKIRLKLSIRDK